MTLEACELSVGERLCEITLTLAPGRITAICGPNGAGKSTLLGALAGLAKPTAGAALLDGENIASMDRKARARTIGFLPQSGQAAWDLSVEALVRLGRMPHGDSARAPVIAALAALDLERYAQRPLSTLSGGETARALLARVLAGQPRWILADEPLAALDLAHQLALLAHLRAAADAGAGVVVVLHDLALAMNHADEVIVLHEGRLYEKGPPEAALSQAVITGVWGVPARWIGDPGARALLTT